jgi:hypothetical protein
MEIPNYIAALLQPQPSKPTGRKVWSIDLETVWLPFFHATNVVKATAIPSEALGAPLRLAYEKDGAVRFSESGRPVIRVAKEISDQVKVVRENFTANLLSFAGKVARTEKDAYKVSVTAAQTAGAPIVARDNEALKAAYDAQAEAQPSVNGAKPDAEPQPQPVGATT